MPAEPEPTPPTELELLQKQNAELMKQVSQQNQVIQQTQKNDWRIDETSR